MKTTRVFQVRQGGTGAILWTGEAPRESEVLDTMAHAAGYRDRAALPASIDGRGFSVEELRFDLAAARGPEGRIEGGRAGRVAAHGRAAPLPGRAAG